MSYVINNKPISDFGITAGSLKNVLSGYALDGIWSLPKRTGETHRQWGEAIEPYVNAEDIQLDGRSITLSLVAQAASSEALKQTIDRFGSHIGYEALIQHPVLGSYRVGVEEMIVKSGNRCACSIDLKLSEPNPTLGSIVPPADGATNGIDGISWEKLGFIVQGMDNRFGLSKWQTLSVTADKKSLQPGYRSARSVTITGTIKGDNYADFNQKICGLQALMRSPGLRTLSHEDGTRLSGFCPEGFNVSNVSIYSTFILAKFNCKITIVS